MYTKDGVFLKVIAEREDWIWAVRSRPKAKFVCVGCNDGAVSMYQTIFSTVHGLYQDRYAHRDTMTDVIIQHLITEQKVRIKTRDYVKKIAVYKSEATSEARLAVQLPDRVLVYETVNQESYDMHYRLREKIVKKLECTNDSHTPPCAR
jgi:intraflagellar transport protein 122